MRLVIDGSVDVALFWKQPVELEAVGADETAPRDMCMDDRQDCLLLGIGNEEGAHDTTLPFVDAEDGLFLRSAPFLRPELPLAPSPVPPLRTNVGLIDLDGAGEHLGDILLHGDAHMAQHGEDGRFGIPDMQTYPRERSVPEKHNDTSFPDGSISADARYELY